jgi:secreted trypsin-like serine protease
LAVLSSSLLFHTFQGDSGGSAIAFQAGVPKLVGVANFIVKSCGSEFPDAYAKVSFYRRWIQETIWRVESARIEVFPHLSNFLIVD